VQFKFQAQVKKIKNNIFFLNVEMIIYWINLGQYLFRLIHETRDPSHETRIIS
jgi:hypothetical protein